MHVWYINLKSFSKFRTIWIEIIGYMDLGRQGWIIPCSACSMLQGKQASSRKVDKKKVIKKKEKEKKDQEEGRKKKGEKGKKKKKKERKRKGRIDLQYMQH